jgi:hypothetical protein
MRAGHQSRSAGRQASAHFRCHPGLCREIGISPEIVTFVVICSEKKPMPPAVKNSGGA